MFGDLCSFQDLHRFVCPMVFAHFISDITNKMSIEDIRLGTVIEFSSINGAVFCYQLTQTSDSYTQD